MDEGNTGAKILEALLETYRILGAKRTIDVLNDAAKNSIEGEIGQFNTYIIKTVCKYFRVSESDLFNSNYRGDKTCALAFYTYFLHLHFKYSTKKLGKIIDRHYSQASRYITFVQNLNPEIKGERELLDKLNSMSILLNQEKEKIFKQK